MTRFEDVKALEGKQLKCGRYVVDVQKNKRHCVVLFLWCKDCDAVAKYHKSTYIQQRSICNCKSPCRLPGPKSRNYKHGLARNARGVTDRHYRIALGAIDRCHNTKNKSYPRYGGSAIYVSEEFRNDVIAFVEYIKSLPGADDQNATLDRIKNLMGYERGNMRWATKREQSANRHCTKIKIGKHKYSTPTFYKNFFKGYSTYEAAEQCYEDIKNGMNEMEAIRSNGGYIAPHRTDILGEQS